MAAVERRRPGEVRDAIVEHLRGRPSGASVAEIHEAVEHALGAKVARSSVRSYLGINTRDGFTHKEDPLFMRLGRGSYRLLET